MPTLEFNRGVRARLEEGNRNAWFAVILFDDNPNYYYYYELGFSRLKAGSFETTATPPLNSPSFVADASKNYTIVGRGPAFAPNLSKIRGWSVNSSYNTPLVRCEMSIDLISIGQPFP